MSSADLLSELPALDARENTLVCAIHDAAQRLGQTCSIADILLATGWGISIVAAEEWCDPATVMWHPMMVDRTVPALAQVVTAGLSRLHVVGLDCQSMWFTRTELAALREYVLHVADAYHVVVLWGMHGPGYAVVQHASATHVISVDQPQSAIAYDALDARGGIHCVIVSRHQYAMPVPYWELFTAALHDANRIEFATPNHPLRTTQTWHIGVGAWDVLAYVARQAAPLSLVSTHVGKIVRDYAWRLAHLRAFFEQYRNDVVPLPQRMRVRAAIDDCCFYIGILYKQYAFVQHHHALTTADGELIAQVCSDIAVTLRDMKRYLRGNEWWAEQDSNL